MVRFHLLGAVEAVGSDGVLDLGPRKQRALLARLLVDPGRVVSTDALADAVWDVPPPSAQASLQVFVSNLRKALRDPSTVTSPILRQGNGYVLDVSREETDIGRFVAGCARVQTTCEELRWREAVTAADDTLELWGGPPAQEFADQEWVRVAAAPAEELRTALLANRVRALLGSDQIDAAVAGARSLTIEQPLNETATWLHAVALHRAGRSPEALEVLRTFARVLDDELALDTGPAVRDLQASILRQDRSLQTWPNEPLARPSEAPTAGVARLPPTVAPVDAAPPAESWLGEAQSDAEGFVGRRRELGTALAVLAGAPASASARWLVLTGEAGIGKTRLADQVVATWRHRVVRTGCPDDDGVPLWWPVRRLLEGVGADAEQVLATPTDIDADAARFAVYDAVTRVLARTLSEGPLLLVIEDVHWADVGTLRLLTHLAGTAGDQLPGLAVVATTRPVEENAAVGRLVSTVTRRGDSRVLPVPPLSSGEVADLAALVSGSRLAGDEAVQLAMRTGGNPFFVCEYARLPLAERADDGVPAGVATVLDRRLATLDVATLQLLRTAAVIGDTLDIDLLGRTARLDRDQLADLLDEAADERIIVTSADRGSAVDGSTGSYVFGHALLRAKLLADLPGPRRQRLHLRVADSVRGADLQSLSQRAAHLVAASPLSEAEATFAACRAAAEAFEARLEPELAATWWGHAIDAFDRLGEASVDTLDRDDLVVAQVISLARAGRGQTVLEAIDSALFDAVRRSRYDSVARLAATLLRTSGSWPWAVYGTDPAPLVARLIDLETLVRDHPATRVRVLAALAVGSCYSPDEHVPDRLSEQAIDLAETLGDPEVLTDALLGRALAFSGVAVRAEETLRLLDRLDVVRREGPRDHGDQGAGTAAERNHDDVIAHGLAYLANVSLGRLDTATQHVRAGIARSDLLRLSTSRVQFRWAEASLMLARGDDLDEVETMLRRAADLHRQTELYQSGTFDIALFTLRWHQGRLSEEQPSEVTEADSRVMPWATPVRAAATGSGDTASLVAADLERVDEEPPLWTTHYHLTMLAHAAADAGVVGLAPALLARLDRFAGRVANVGQVSIAGPVDLAIARLHLLVGDRDAASTALASAEDLARSAGARGWLRQCHAVAGALDGGPSSAPDRVSVPPSP